jgi:hypothetical protein
MLNAYGVSLRRTARAAMMLALAAGSASSYAQSSQVVQAWQELFALSQKEKKGLTFYVKGQNIGGAVTKVMGNDAVEVRNQTYGRIIIRMDQIDAVAAN